MSLRTFLASAFDLRMWRDTGRHRRRKASQRTLVPAIEPLEQRQFLSCNRIALVVNGLGGGDEDDDFLSERIVDELVDLGYRGFGNGPNNLTSDWNSLLQEGAPGGLIFNYKNPQVTTKPFPSTINFFGSSISGFPSEIAVPAVAVIEIDIGEGTTTDFVNEAAALLNQYSDADTIVLIGHSLGGDAVIKLARAVNVEIDLLALLDPVGFLPVPDGTTTMAEAEEATGKNFNLPDDIDFEVELPFINAPPLVEFEIATPFTVKEDQLRNSEGEMPGFRAGLKEVPTNVKQLYNRWQTNGIFPLDFELSGKLGDHPDQQSQNDTDSYSVIPVIPGDSEEVLAKKYMAFSYGHFGKNPVIPDFELLNPVPIGGHKDPDFLMSDAQFHADFPANDTIEDELIDILREITPPIEADDLEANNSIGSATFLGSEPVVTLTDLTIHELADVDVFAITANQTGELRMTAQFDGGAGQLVLEVRDKNNNVIDSFLPLGFTPGVAAPKFSAAIPVVSQQTYYVRISGDQAQPAANFCYSLELENFAAPVPSAVVLHPSDDNGVSFNDNVTDSLNPRIVIQADLSDFANHFVRLTNNGILGPDEVTNKLSGAAVEVFVDGRSRGFATPRGVTNNVIFDFTLKPQDLFFGTAVQGGFLNIVSAAVRIFDGQRDAMGNAAPAQGRTQLSEPLPLIWADTTGPQVTGVQITDARFNLFLGKEQNVPAPTPLITSLSVNILDLPVRSTPATVGSATALATITPAMVRLVGDHTGVIPIKNVAFDADPLLTPNPATGVVRIEFFEPLPDDRYTLTLLDTITDPAGNRLDGESDAAQPNGAPTFPSGDGQAGGDFVARFTVDSLPEIGVASAGSVQVDTNGNRFWDPTNGDQTNRDLTYVLGNPSDYIFAGNFSAPNAAMADGFDKLAAYGRVGGQWRWLIDLDNNGVPDLNIVDPEGVNGFPIAGDFDDNAANGDEVGVFDGANFWFDTNHDFKVDRRLASNLRGHPIAGDFDGDGIDDVATYRNDRGDFEFDLSGVTGELTGNVAAVIHFQFPGVMQRPVAHDMDGDGIDDIGLRVAGDNFAGNTGVGDWFFLISNDRIIPDEPDDEPDEDLEEPVVAAIAPKRTPGTVVTLAHEFSPAPLGEDLFIHFGDEFGIPLVGNFDPPVAAESPKSVAPSQASQVVAALYLDILGRPVDSYGLSYYVNQLAQGATSRQVARTLMNSPERFGYVIDGIYATILHRAADSGGRQFWIDALLGGAVEEDVAVSFLESAEYAASRPSDGSFIEGLYRDVLGRTADPAGVVQWTAELATGQSRAEIAYSFFRSRERQAKVVDQVYRHMLHRRADLGGLDYFTDQLVDEETSLRELVATLAASDEYSTLAARRR